MESPFIEVLLGSEDSLVERILADAEANGGAGFVPRDPKEWRPVVRGVSGSIVQALRGSAEHSPLDPNDKEREDGRTAFLVVEARKRRLQGIPLDAFLGIVKLLRRAYGERIRSAGFPPEEEAGCRRVVERFFDRNEAAFCASWVEDSLREQSDAPAAKEEWEKAIDSVGDMILLVDPDGFVRRCNRPFRDFVDRPYAEILDRPCLETLGEIGLPRELPRGQAVEHFHEKLGRWFVLRVYPFQAAPGGEASGTVVVLRDVTEAKTAAGEIERGNARVKEAPAGLPRSQAAGLARDIHRPIGAVVGNLTALRRHMARVRDYLAEQSSCIDKGAPPNLADAVRRKREAVGEILEDAACLLDETLEEAESVRATVGDLEGFERTGEADFRQADVNDCLRDAVLSVRDAFRDRATLERKYGRLPRTRCNPPQLTRAFSDLLLDAARSVREGGAVTLRSWVEDGCVRVSVCGAGREIPGDRLDLSVAHDIVGRHGGEIRVRSGPGSGTEFIVSVPLVLEN